MADSHSGSLVWLDRLKAVAIVWIFLNHFGERLFGFPYMANPTPDWPALGERLAQLRPLVGYGGWSFVVNTLRYIAWSGDQGVQLFLVASGFGLTWGLLRRHGTERLALGEFYRRRAVRIYPLWIGGHVALAGAAYMLGVQDWLTDPRLVMSMAGVRATEGLFYFMVPAWWYIGLLLQLYLVYPILWAGLRRLGPGRLLAVSCAIAFGARGWGLVTLDGYMDAWQRGAVFVTRLPEFVLGVAVAGWLHGQPERWQGRLRRGSTVAVGIVVYAVGSGLSLLLLGMAVAPFLLAIGTFMVLYRLLTVERSASTGAWGVGRWIGRHSYSLFLVHQPIVTLLIDSDEARHTVGEIAGKGVAAVGLTVVAAVVLERVVDGVVALVGSWRTKVGVRGVAVRAGAIGAIVGVVAVGAELVIRQVDPQEALGWGERASLQPDDRFGWRLKPSRTTRLRWESYDYTVTANALGFPGPECAVDGPNQGYRVLVTGDAFTSAEGVDTTDAWPRLMEGLLAERLSVPVEVLNLAITGYGPCQYRAVIEAFGPRYRPDVIVVAMFVNDYQDVSMSVKKFRRSIGFGRPDPAGWRSVVRLAHLRQWVRRQFDWVRDEWLLGRPSAHGYFLGNFAALRRDADGRDVTEYEAVRTEMAGIKAVADAVGAPVVVVMIPAPVQVCGASDLAYYPGHVDLGDGDRFDLERPQRLTRRLANELGMIYHDLRPALAGAPDGCPYQARNMHWTVAGHRVVATDVAARLVQGDLLGGRQGATGDR